MSGIVDRDLWEHADGQVRSALFRLRSFAFTRLFGGSAAMEPRIAGMVLVEAELQAYQALPEAGYDVTFLRRVWPIRRQRPRLDHSEGERIYRIWARLPRP